MHAGVRRPHRRLRPRRRAPAAAALAGRAAARADRPRDVDLVWSGAATRRAAPTATTTALTAHAPPAVGQRRRALRPRARAPRRRARDARGLRRRVRARVRDGGLCVVRARHRAARPLVARGRRRGSRRCSTRPSAAGCRSCRSTRRSRTPRRRRRRALPVTTWGDAARPVDVERARASAGWRGASARAELRALGARRARPDRALRELLALQASDWAFLLTRATAGEYPARARRGHRAALDAALAGAGRGRAGAAQPRAAPRRAGAVGPAAEIERPVRGHTLADPSGVTLCYPARSQPAESPPPGAAGSGGPDGGRARLPGRIAARARRSAGPARARQLTP